MSKEKCQAESAATSFVYIAEYYDGFDSGIQGVFATPALAEIEVNKVTDEGEYWCRWSKWSVQKT